MPGPATAADLPGFAFGRCADIAGVALIVLLAVTVTDVAARYFGLFNLRGTVEVAAMASVLIGFLALPRSFLEGEHIVVDLATRALPPRLNFALDVLWLGLATLSLAYAAVSMWLATFDVLRKGEISLDLQLPMAVFWFPATIGLSLVPFACAVALIRKLRAAG